MNTQTFNYTRELSLLSVLKMLEYNRHCIISIVHISTDYGMYDNSLVAPTKVYTIKKGWLIDINNPNILIDLFGYIKVFDVLLEDDENRQLFNLTNSSELPKDYYLTCPQTYKIQLSIPYYLIKGR